LVILIAAKPVELIWSQLPHPIRHLGNRPVYLLYLPAAVLIAAAAYRSWPLLKDHVKKKYGFGSLQPFYAVLQQERCLVSCSKVNIRDQRFTLASLHIPCFSRFNSCFTQP